MLTEKEVIKSLDAYYVKVKATGRFGTVPDFDKSKYPTNHIYVPGYGLTTRKKLWSVFTTICKTSNKPYPKDQYSLVLEPLETLQPETNTTFSNFFEEVK